MEFKTKYNVGDHIWYLCGLDVREGRVNDIKITSTCGHFFIYYFMPVQGWVEESKTFENEEICRKYYKKYPQPGNWFDKNKEK